MPGLTPSQTVGPYFSMRLPWPDGPFVVPEGTSGAITVVGRLYDGAGNIIPDGLIETWQAGPDGRFAHPDDPRGATPGGYQSFRGFGRCPTAPDGSYRIDIAAPRVGRGAMMAVRSGLSAGAELAPGQMLPAGRLIRSFKRWDGAAKRSLEPDAGDDDV